MNTEIIEKDTRKNKMNIVFGCSKEYAQYACVMLQSLFENNTNQFIRLYVMINEELGIWKEKMEYIAKAYDNDIEFIKLPLNIYEKEIKKIWPSTINTDRWLALELLPEDIDRFLMLGVDILVRGDLWEWYNSDFEDKYMIMCKDQFIASHCNSNVEWAIALKNYHIGRLDEKFGNSEIVLVNRSFKKMFNYNHMINTILEKQYSTVDQDYFNVHMGKYIKIIEPYEYNYLAEMGHYEDVIDKIKIIHYTLKKPWKDYCNSLWEKLWIECAKRTSGCEEIAANYEAYVNDSRFVAWKYNNLYHTILNDWMDIRDRGSHIFMKYEYSKIALYGAGRMCQHLICDLKKTTIQCKGIFDKNMEVNSIKEFTVTHELKRFLKDIADVEVIIVTAISSYDEIKDILKGKTDIPILSLEEMIRGDSVL